MSLKEEEGGRRRGESGTTCVHVNKEEEEAKWPGRRSEWASETVRMLKWK